MTYRTIGSKFGVSTERARQICRKGEIYAGNGYGGPLNRWLEDERLSALTVMADQLALHAAAIRAENERRRLNSRRWSHWLSASAYISREEFRA